MIDEQFALEAKHVQEGHALSLVKIAFMIGSLIAFSIPLYYQKVTTGQFIALSSALSEVMTLAVWSIPYSLSMVKKDILYWNDFDKFMHLPEIPPETRWEHIDNLTRGISFNDVYFKYPNTTKEVLRGVSFRLRPGERVAIVGKNGAGKSTLIKLLLGLYQPDQGSITLDGVNVNLIHPRDRRRLMAAVFQDFTRYHLTLRENIGFGQIEKMKDDQAIWNAIHKGMADDVANSLSHGLDTYLGKIYVGGTDLSHGQWQRLAISRAWMSDAQIMILDEPASALDPVAEADLYEGFARLAVGKTWILVSHRLGSARLADRILVVDQGQIVEEGSHDQLMGLGGIYRQMYEAQAEWYIKDVSV